MNDFVRGSKGVFRPHCASAAHRPRAPARVDRTRTFGKNDFVQMTFFSASKKNIILSEKSLFFLTCLGPACCVFSVRVSVCVLRVRVFCVCLCVCPFVCVCVCVCVCVVVSTQNTPVCPLNTSRCVRSKRPHVFRHHAHTRVS